MPTQIGVTLQKASMVTTLDLSHNADRNRARTGGLDFS